MSAILGSAEVEGLQGGRGRGPTDGYLGGAGSRAVAALAKHFVAYGAAAGGLNAARAELSERTLRDVFLAPWRALVRAGARGVMPAHQPVFDAPCHGSAYVGQTLLRDELGFEGLSVSDCSDVGALVQWRVARDNAEAAALGMAATVDQDNQCGDNATWAYLELADAVRRAASTRRRSARASRACCATSSRCGSSTSPSPTRALANLSLPASRAGLEAARRSIVLLKNANGTLPLALGGRRRAARARARSPSSARTAAGRAARGGGGGARARATTTAATAARARR